MEFENKEVVNRPLVSVIIPIYNVGTTIYRMIECLEQQTFQMFELILVNDGSTDESEEICKTIIRNHQNYYLYSKENQGAFSARNLGIEKANGAYLTFLDADDKIDSNYLEILFHNCMGTDIAVCDVAVYKEDTEISRFTGGNQKITQTQALNKLLVRKEINSGPCGKMFSQKIIEEVRFPFLSVYEDILFVLECFCKVREITVTDKTTYYYMQEDTGTMGRMAKSPSVDIIAATEKIMDFIADRRDLSEECTYITISHLYQYALPVAIQNNYRGCEFILKTQILYRKYMEQILKCKAMPWKEKVIFYLYAHGYVYTNKFIKKIQR